MATITGVTAEKVLAIEAAGKRLLQDAVVDVNGNGTHLTIAAALADIAPGGRIVIKSNPSNPIVSHWQDGSIKLPNINGVTIEGWGKEVAGIAFPSGSNGFYFDGTANPRNWVFRNLYIFSLGPLDGNSRGTVGRGIDLSGATTCIIENVRLSGFLEGIHGNGTEECHHMRFVNVRITNCGTGIKTVHPVGGMGTNSWQIIGGEISGNGVGIDTGGGAWRVYGPSFESNGLALRYGGEASRFDMGRLEGNTQDIELTANARNNVIDAPMLDIWKYTDLSTNNSNLVNSNSRFSYVTSPKPVLQSIDLRNCSGNVSLDANVAYFVKFVTDRVMKVDTITVVPTLTGGNIDAAIIDPLAGTDVISNTAGPRALGANNTRQDLVLPTPVYLMPGREYRVAVVLDNASSTLFGQPPGTGYGQIVANGILFTVTNKASMYPLAGKTWSGLNAASRTPWIWIH